MSVIVWRITAQGVSAYGGSQCSVSLDKVIGFIIDLQVDSGHVTAMAEHNNVVRRYTCWCSGSTTSMMDAFPRFGWKAASTLLQRRTGLCIVPGSTCSKSRWDGFANRNPCFGYRLIRGGGLVMDRIVEQSDF